MRLQLVKQLSANNGKKGGYGEKEGCEKSDDEREGKDLIDLAEAERRNHPERFTALYKGGLLPRLRGFLGGGDCVREPLLILHDPPSDFSKRPALYFSEGEELARYYARLAKRIHPTNVAAGVLKVWVKTEQLKAMDIEGDDWKKVCGDNLTHVENLTSPSLSFATAHNQTSVLTRV